MEKPQRFTNKNLLTYSVCDNIEKWKILSNFWSQINDLKEGFFL